ncbi:MAG: flagellar biosynthesis protein FlhB [Planctomycetota bacterium]|jgi:flagellar biosynthetic protein FlhB|nr:flagellar biosynthesis protein FlhB [Planctomycetota bacterium]
MAEEQLGDKTEPATPRKRQDSREKGQVAQSKDLSSTIILLAALLGLAFFGDVFIEGIIASTVGVLENLHQLDLEQDNLLSEYGKYFGLAFMGLLPVLIVVFVGALAINLLQVGFLLTAKPLTPDITKLDPIKGIGKLFSLRGLMRMVFGIFKLTVIGVVSAITIWQEWNSLMALFEYAFPDIVEYLIGIVFTLALRATIALLILALLDFGYQKFQHEKDLRMSKQEVKEEMKRYEGDPKIKERRKAIQRQLAMQRMMDQVPKATVVVTNPTHYSVALQYTKENMDAPIVSAKGVDELAFRIREVAMENDIPVVERPEVARALYRNGEVGAPIPLDLYQAVAEILAYVYRLKGAAA